ncbi:MAG: cytochrome c, partial [Bacteroidota bacterium]
MNDCCSDFRKITFLTYLLLLPAFLAFSWTASLAQDAAADSTATEASGGGDDGSGIPSSPEAIAEGESIFNNNCTVCHAINQVVVGPALAGVENRWENLETLVAFISNSQKVIQGGNEYAVNLYNEYNKTLMPAFSDYSDEQILNIVGYIKAEAAKPAQAETPTGGGGEGGEQVASGGGGIPSGYLTAIIVGLLVVLVLILLVLVLIISVLTRFLNQKQDLDEADREVINQKVDVQKVAKSRPFIGIMLFI